MNFYIKHIMHSVEWKLYFMINKNKNVKNNVDRIWRQSLHRKFERYRV